MVLQLLLPLLLVLLLGSSCSSPGQYDAVADAGVSAGDNVNSILYSADTIDLFIN